LIGNGGRGGGAGNRVSDRVGQRHDLAQNRGENRAQNRQQRTDNLQNRLDDRYDRQGQRQGNRGDRQQSRRNDWYGHHGGWHNGYWHGGAWGWGSRWNYMWNNYPGLMAFGITSWGLNRIAYWSGYGAYANPYVTGDASVVSYSQPVLAEPPYEVPADAAAAQPAPTTTPAAEPLPPGVSQKGMTAFDKAQSEFKAGNYTAALASVDAALKEMPRDAIVNEFRALVLFAQKDYKHAAETLYAVLSVGPGWDWTTLSGLYASVDDYTKQLKALESYVLANPKDAAAHFVLGYHYTTCGHKEAAGKQFQEALQLNPKDVVSKQMLDMLGVTPETEATPPKEEKKPPTIPLASLVGNWTAKRGSATFQLMLAKDNAFTWTYTEGSRKTVLKGVFAVDGDTLAMEPDAGGVMVATVKLEGKDALAFKMVGEEKDPGLAFKK
jgi:tetratricopeptide (TPR) repeat protein